MHTAERASSTSREAASEVGLFECGLPVPRAPTLSDNGRSVKLPSGAPVYASYRPVFTVPCK